jgi:hypothetical protein
MRVTKALRLGPEGLLCLSGIPAKKNKSDQHRLELRRIRLRRRTPAFRGAPTGSTPRPMAVPMLLASVESTIPLSNTDPVCHWV